MGTWASRVASRLSVCILPKSGIHSMTHMYTKPILVFLLVVLALLVTILNWARGGNLPIVFLQIPQFCLHRNADWGLRGWGLESNIGCANPPGTDYYPYLDPIIC